MSFTVVDLSVKERLNAVALLMEQAQQDHGGVFAVLIDGIGDLCTDPNDSAEAFGLVNHMHRLAVKHSTAIITVLHENPGSESGKTRGHLGSHLERKAETNLRLAKDKNNVTTIWSEKARHLYLPKDQGVCFAWNDSSQMHTSCGSAGDIKQASAREKAQDEAGRAFGESEALSYTDLTTAIMDVLTLKERSATGRIKTWASDGIIRKDANGNYRLTNP